jgi:hypothetical protein
VEFFKIQFCGNFAYQTHGGLLRLKNCLAQDQIPQRLLALLEQERGAVATGEKVNVFLFDKFLQ